MKARTGVTDAEADRAAWTVGVVVTGDGAGDGGGAVAGGVTAGGVEVGGVSVAGLKVGGARAVGLALSVGRNAAWPTLVWKLPVVPWALDRVYDVIAKNRHRLPGQTPWCKANPGRCSPFAP